MVNIIKLSHGTMISGGHKLDLIQDAFVCTGRIWEVRSGEWKLKRLYMVPVYHEYMIGANIGLYSNMFSRNADEILWDGGRCLCRCHSDGYMPVLNPECCGYSENPFDVKIAEYEEVGQSEDDLSSISIRQMFAVVLKKGEWWRKANERQYDNDESDCCMIEGWDALHKIVEIYDKPISYGREKLLRENEKYIPSWYRNFETGRDYIEAMNDVGLDGERYIKTMFNNSRIGFLNCSKDGSGFKSYYDPSLFDPSMK